MLAFFLVVVGVLELASPYPPVSDSNLFPSYQRCCEQYWHARDHQDWLRMQKYLDRGTPAEDLWEAWEDDARDRVRIWEAAASAQLDYGSSWKREALAYLKSLLTEADYYAGRLPPPLPLWRYIER